MKRIILMIAIAILLAAVPARAEDWDNVEKGAFGAYVACNFMDYLQTREVFERGDIELNPVIASLTDEMGKTGVTLYFAGTTAATYLLSETIFKNHRKVFLGIMVGSSAGTVGWNLRMGYRFR